VGGLIRFGGFSPCHCDSLMPLQQFMVRRMIAEAEQSLMKQEGGFK
jgi:hypothetical protein